jgi:glutathione S-transferase
MAELRLHDYPASANCLKARIALRQLGLQFERVNVDIFAGDTLTDEFAALNPFRSTPVLEVAGEGVLIESNAILWYLAEGTELLPDDPFRRAQVMRWLIYEQTDVMPAIGGLRFRLMTGRLASDDRDAQRRRRNALEVLAFLDSHLEHGEFLVGRFSIADIAVYAYTHVARDAELDLDACPHVVAWIARVESTPGFVDDLVPYPANSRPGVSVSTYDPV